MPPIRMRLDPVLDQHEPIAQPVFHTYTPERTMESSPSALHVSGNSSNLMSITGGNSVPMRGIPPIEQMSDSDIYRFFPYTAYFDRIPKYTYYSLLAQSK